MFFFVILHQTHIFSAMKHFFILLAIIIATTASAQNTRKTTPKRPQTTTTRKNTKATTPKNTSQAAYKDVTFNIKGKTHGYDDGEWVRLCTPGENGLVTRDSAKITNNEFRFAGKTKSIPHLQYITVGQGLKKNIVEVFLEEGTTQIELFAGEKRETVTGTTHNNIYSAYRDSLNAIYTNLYACISESVRLTNSEEDREAYKAGADLMRKKLTETSYVFAGKNMNNWVGVYLFAEYYKKFTPAQNKTLMAKVPAKYKNLPIMLEIKQFINKQK